MALLPRPTQDTLLDMAAFLVRDTDRIAKYAAQVSNMPKMAAKYEGEIQGQRNALAMIAGFLEYGTVDELIAHVRAFRPTIAGNGRRETVHQAEAARPIDSAGAIARVMAASPAEAWPVDHADGNE